MSTLSELPAVHDHRLNHNPSKLPSYRFNSGPPPPHAPTHEPATLEPAHTHKHPEYSQVSLQHQHARSHSDSATTATKTTLLTLPASPSPSQPTPAPAFAKPRKDIPAVPAKYCRNDGLKDSRPPPSIQKYYLPMTDNTSTSDWVAEQSSIPQSISIPASVESPSTDRAQDPKPPLTPIKVPPIRSFRSSRRSTEMNATPVRSPMDQDNQDETLRALEGIDRIESQRSSNRENEEQNSDDSDLFLKLAREEASTTRPPARGIVRRVCTFPTKSHFPWVTII